MENCSTADRKERLFSQLDDVIAISHEKVTAERGNSDEGKRGWARVLIQAVSVYGCLLKDEELELRVLELEQKLANSILIPKEEEQK